MKNKQRSAPIGVFDSGLGGLTVLKALKNIMPNEDFTYLGDTANLPYGIKSEETIQFLLTKNIDFLLQKKVKAIIVACNSASTVIIHNPISIDIPIYNVIEPGAQKAYESTTTKSIGVLGTLATINGKAYINELQKLDPNIQVFQQASPLLVPLVEEGWVQDPITRLILYRYLTPLLEKKIDTLILGCTHYPILKESVKKVVGQQIEIVDSAQIISHLVKNDLEHKELLTENKTQGKIQIYTTDKTTHFTQIAKSILAPILITDVLMVEV